jgi:hypothetical protein
MLSPVSIIVLYAILVLCMLAMLGVTLAMYVRVKRQMHACEDALRHALREVDQREAVVPEGQVS